MKIPIIYTAAIIRTDDQSISPWIISFSSREMRDAFIEETKARIAEHHLDDKVIVTGDSGALGDTSCLDHLR